VTIEIRSAQPVQADADAFAAGLDASTGGLVTTMLGPAAHSVIAEVSMHPGHDLSLQWVRIAEVDGRIAGISSGLGTEQLASPDRLITREAGWRVLRALPIYLGLRPLLRILNWHDPGDWYLQALAVDPHQQSRGVGTALLRDAISSARNRGYSWFTLDIDAANAGAQSLYDRHGLAVVATSKPARLLRGAQVKRMALDLEDQ